MSKSLPHFTRRAWMRTFAGVASAGVFRRLLRDAVAQPAATPPRFVVISNPHGCAPTLWRPRAPGGGAAAETGWTLTYDPDSSLGPLERHKDSLVIIEGLDLTCNYQNVNPILTGHNGGAVAPLTGRRARSEKDSMRTNGPSIDTYLAKKMGCKPFMFMPTGYSGGNLCISFNDAGERIPYEFDPMQTYTSWFGNVTAGAPDPSAAARQNAELAVLKSLNADATRLRNRLAAPERQKMEAHLDALALIERGLTKPTTVTCEKPAKPSTTDPEKLRGNLGLAIEMAARMFACDLTRVATLILGMGQSMPWLGLGNVKIHDDIAHGYRPSDEASGRKLSKVQRWHAEQVAKFIDLLKAIPEGGRTVYDNTIILWGNELGDPARHMNNNVPFVLAGGGGAWKKGRYLQYGVAAEYRDPQDPHGRLLTSIVQQYGANVQAFGDPAYPGPLPRLV